MRAAANTATPLPAVDPLDRPLWGAKAIAEYANILDDQGEPDTAKASYLLRKGELPATKISDTWVSTPRRLLDRFNQVDVGDRKRGRGRPKGER
jgi:hypothetical protein